MAARKPKSKGEKFDVYQAVTDQVVAALEAGTVPWRKPWADVGGVQMNARTRKPYRGINQLLLGMTEFGRPYWLTMKQANDVGGTVRKGERSTLVVFWKRGAYNCKAGDAGATLDPATGAFVRESFLLRYYRVFNVDQIEGLPDGMVPEPDDGGRTPHERDELCETVLHGYVDEHHIGYTEGGSRAFYAPTADAIRVPELQHFESPEAYYSTGFHECVHSTGHEKRLRRPGVVDVATFGTEPYGKEELVAELGASMLAALLGIDTAPLNVNRDAYIGSWLTTIKGDPKLVVQAGAGAQKAADMVMGDRYALVVDVTPWEDDTTNDAAVAA